MSLLSLATEMNKTNSKKGKIFGRKVEPKIILIERTAKDKALKDKMK